MGLDTLHQLLGHCTLHMYLSVSNCICLCFNLYLCVWCTLAGLGSDTPHQSVEHNGAQFRPQSPNCIWPRTDLTGRAHQVGSAHYASQLHTINRRAHQRPSAHKVLCSAHYTQARCTHYTQIEKCKQETLLRDPTHGIGSAYYTHGHYTIHRIEVHIIPNVLSL